MSRLLVPLQVDLAQLLAPIAPEHPAGELLRYEGTYDRIQEARREDDDSLPQGVWQTKLKKADWPLVCDLCFTALQTRSKDLQIAVWLMEAWIKLHGLSGLREGLKLLVGLCAEFWETLYPQMEEGEWEQRLGPLEWVDSKLPLALKQIPLTAPETGNTTPLTLLDWEDACHLEQLLLRDPKAAKNVEKQGKVLVKDFHSSTMFTPIEFYLQLNQEIQEISAIMQELVQWLAEQGKTTPPQMGNLKKVLSSMAEMAHKVLAERKAEYMNVAASQAGGAGEDQTLVPTELAACISNNTFRSRADAYRMLSEAAEYLLRIEPHSPVPYLIKRAVSWGSMPLTELLQEIVNNENDLLSIYGLLGVRDWHSNKKK